MGVAKVFEIMVIKKHNGDEYLNSSVFKTTVRAIFAHALPARLNASTTTSDPMWQGT